MMLTVVASSAYTSGTPASAIRKNRPKISTASMGLAPESFGAATTAHDLGQIETDEYERCRRSDGQRKIFDRHWPIEHGEAVAPTGLDDAHAVPDQQQQYRDRHDLRRGVGPPPTATSQEIDQFGDRHMLASSCRRGAANECHPDHEHLRELGGPRDVAAEQVQHDITEHQSNARGAHRNST